MGGRLWTDIWAPCVPGCCGTLEMRNMMNRRKTGIIGGGASGLMAAVAAADRRNGAGDEVVILEKKERIGKKILVTGNGKCNLTNLSFSMEKIGEYYHGAPEERLRSIFSRFSPEDTLKLFYRMGMLTTSREGYVYPLSGQASTVLDTLRFELERLQVRILTECRIVGIEPRGKGGYLVRTEDGNLHFDRLILACGSPAGQKAGEGMDGYAYAEALGHRVIRPQPALTALRCEGDFWKSLAGVRCGVSVSLSISGEEDCYREEGELQLTDYGISGIPVFQLSRHASCALARGRKVQARIDFLPSLSGSRKDYEKMTEQRISACLGRSMEVLFCGLVNKKIVLALLKRNGLRPQDTVEERNREEVRRMFSDLRDFPVRVKSVNPFGNAQVCAGGVPLSEVTDRMESVKHAGLYFAGELLDVDARCGGYNLQWAWTSGFLAGKG